MSNYALPIGITRYQTTILELKVVCIFTWLVSTAQVHVHRIYRELWLGEINSLGTNHVPFTDFTLNLDSLQALRSHATSVSAFSTDPIEEESHPPE